MMVEAVPASFVAFLALCPSLSEPSTGSFQHPHSLCHWWSSGDELIKPIRFVCNAMAEDQHQQLSELRRRRHDEWRGATGVPDDEPSPAEMEAEDTSADEAFARRLQEELNAEVDDDDGRVNDRVNDQELMIALSAERDVRDSNVEAVLSLLE